jgi:peptide/nickel transport system permease protein
MPTSEPQVPNLISGSSRAVATTDIHDAPSGGGLTVPPASAMPEGGEMGSSGSIYRIIGRVFIENKLAVVGLALIILFLVFCFLGPFVYHTQQLQILLRPILAPGTCQGSSTITGPPCPFGTEGQGFDVLGRLMLAGQSDIEVGLAAAAVATMIGVIWGAVAGYVGGIIDSVMMRFVDILLSIPFLLLLIVIATIWRPGKWALVLIIGCLAWLTPARLVRGETLTLRTREYVQAVRVMGGSGRRIVLRHIIPNAIGTIVVNATFQVADAILTLAALSFLGLGLHYPQTDWGLMLNDGSYYVSMGYWWLIVYPGACIVLLVVAFNFIGDALRDSLEVRLQRR